MRTPVEIGKAYRLLNHGPTVLVSTAHGTQRNIMAAAWNMPLDFDPPKVAIVIDKNTYTRQLIEASGQFAINVPSRAQAELVVKMGSSSGRELLGKDHDTKFAAFDLPTFPASRIEAPLLEGCVAWLEGDSRAAHTRRVRSLPCRGDRGACGRAGVFGRALAFRGA